MSGQGSGGQGRAGGEGGGSCAYICVCVLCICVCVCVCILWNRMGGSNQSPIIHAFDWLMRIVIYSLLRIVVHCFMLYALS